MWDPSRVVQLSALSQAVDEAVGEVDDAVDEAVDEAVDKAVEAVGGAVDEACWVYLGYEPAAGTAVWTACVDCGG